MSTERSRAEEARRKARTFFAKDTEKEVAAERERKKSEVALEEKTARLRTLRLAKEAADRETAAARRPAERVKSSRA
jgi:hypothetical protein